LNNALSNKISYPSILVVVAAIAISIAGYKLECFFLLDKDVVSALLTFYSIMTAILLGAISLVGNAISILEKKSEQTKYLYKRTFIQRIAKLLFIFYIYLATIMLLILYISGFICLKKVCIAFLFLSSFLSFILPVYISKIYYDYYPK